MSVLLTSLQHPQLQQHNQNVAQIFTSLTQISVTQSSPSTKNAKRMNQIKELDAFIQLLRRTKVNFPRMTQMFLGLKNSLRCIGKLFKTWKMKCLGLLIEC